MSGGCWLASFIIKKCWNNRTDGRTPHEHLTEVDEVGHQRDGVGREVLQLEPIIL
jgi:hypothetical protein